MFERGGVTVEVVIHHPLGLVRYCTPGSHNFAHSFACIGKPAKVSLQRKAYSSVLVILKVTCGQQCHGDLERGDVYFFFYCKHTPAQAVEIELKMLRESLDLG